MKFSKDKLFCLKVLGREMNKSPYNFRKSFILIGNAVLVSDIINKS